MPNSDFMGGFISTETKYIPENLTTSASQTYDGVFTTGDTHQLRFKNSWPKIISGPPSLGVYRTSSSGNTGTINIDTSTYGNYVFVSLSGPGGGGGQDNDCSSGNIQPGAPGGKIKALVDMSSVGSSTINYTLGTGGQGGQGNDVPGSAGNSSSCTIGNFSLTANSGSGGPGGGSGNPVPGNATANGPYLSFSTSSVFVSSSLIDRTGQVFTFTPTSTNAGGGGARCGDGARGGTGAAGFIYIRYGTGMNSNASISPGQEGTQASAYTPAY